jgi:DNA-directed RNA polymerase subunit RPC12/RpoP
MKFVCPDCGAEEKPIDEGAILVCQICSGWVEKEKDDQETS